MCPTSWTAPSLYGQDVDVPESDLYPAPRQSRPCVLSAFDAVKSIQPRGSSLYVSWSLTISHLTLDTFPALGRQGGCRGVISSPGAAVRGGL